MNDDPVSGGGASIDGAVTESGTKSFDNSAGADILGPGGMFQNLSEIAAQPLEWIWEGLIPQRKLTLITGEPGVGKSLFALQVAAMVSRGLRTPWKVFHDVPSETGEDPLDHPQTHRSLGAQLAACGTLASTVASSAEASNRRPAPVFARSTIETQGVPGSVLLFSADDGLADTVRPRLEAAEADISRVLILSSHRPEHVKPVSSGRQNSRRPESSTFRLERDMEMLEENLLALQADGADVRLIVIDPIDCYLRAAEKNSDLTAIVARLSRLAEWSGAGLLVVANSTSSGIGRTGYRSGTIGNEELANAARSVLMIVHDLECEQQRLVLPVKINLGPQSPGLTFSIQDGALEWNSTPIPLTGDEYFLQAKEKLRNPLIREERSEINRVTNWLRNRLSQGSASSVVVRADACENEIAYSTLRRAFRQLGCQAIKVKGAGRWYWRLPGIDPITSVAEFADFLNRDPADD